MTRIVMTTGRGADSFCMKDSDSGIATPAGLSGQTVRANLRELAQAQSGLSFPVAHEISGSYSTDEIAVADIDELRSQHILPAKELTRVSGLVFLR